MNHEKRVFALDPTSKGYGYVVFEGPQRLVDWGHVGVNPKNTEETLESIARNLSHYNPDVVVTEDWIHNSSRKRLRVQQLLDRVADYVLSSGADIECYSPSDVERYFAGREPMTKYDIATFIAKEYPELETTLPPERKLWQSEDVRMSIFDAAAFTLTHFYFEDTLAQLEEE